jgi:hypothetical protein
MVSSGDPMRFMASTMAKNSTIERIILRISMFPKYLLARDRSRATFIIVRVPKPKSAKYANMFVNERAKPRTPKFSTPRYFPEYDR